jgi:serine protease
MNLRKPILLFGVLLLLGGLLLPARTSFAAASDQKAAEAMSSMPVGQDATPLEMPTDQIILKYKTLPATADAANPESAEELQRLSDTAGVQLTYVREMSGDAYVLGLPSRMPLAEVQAIADSLNSLPDVDYAEPDAIMTPTLAPNDPLYGDQWHYFAPGSGHYGINAPAAWDITTGSPGIVVAVIDTGITNHADLSGRTVPGYDFISNVTIANDGNGRDNNPSDPGDWIVANECYAGSPASPSSWHGTHTAGTIGAASNNGMGVAGVNWGSKILPVRVLGKCGGLISDIVDSMRWSAGLSVPGVPNNSNVAKVLNMSLSGGGSCAATYQTAINTIIAAGVTVVVSAGNNNANASGFQPANCNGVITVAATNRNGSRAFYSNYGEIVEISAPGGETTISSNGVLSTLNTGTQGPVADAYAYYQGTSMSAPHVAGVASLMLSRNPTLTPAQILSIMQSTVTNFPGGSTCNTSICGSGIVNAGAAVSAVPATDLEKLYLPVVMREVTMGGAPAAPTLNPISNGDGDGNYTVSWSASTGATSYLLQEDDNSGFSSPATAYSGANTSWAASGKPNGTYYYRVRASNAIGPSGWSNTQSTVVSPPSNLVNGDFEQGRTGWTEFSTHGWAIIVDDFAPTSVIPHSGSWAAWMGGDFNDTSYIQQQVTVPAARPYLRYYHWIASADACGFDFANVLINGSSVHQYDLCSAQNTGGWVNHSVNLSAYAGQSVMLRIRVTTDSSENSNLFVDDVSFQSSASSAPDAVAPDADPQAAAARSGALQPKP